MAIASYLDFDNHTQKLVKDIKRKVVIVLALLITIFRVKWLKVYKFM